MKKQIVLTLGLAVLAAPAIASKARLQALGEDTYGSFYINDNRNIFLNAANLNSYSNLVTFETGSETGDSAEDSAAAARPEGGVFFTQGNLAYGVHLGSESNTSNSLRFVAGADTEQNNIDLFVAGDAGVKWGANLTYGHVTETETVNNSDILRTRLGVIAGDLEGFANISLKNEVNNHAGEEFKGKMGYQIGGAYSMNSYKLFAEYRNIAGEDASNDEASIKLLRVGAGRTDKLNDKAHLFTKLEVNRTTLNVDDAYGIAAAPGVEVATGGEDFITTNLPLTVGLEYDAASWLTLRGSVSQSIMSDTSIKDQANKNLEDTTVVNAGASLKFGELSVDGVVGNSSIGTNGEETISAAGTNGSLRTDNLMSRVSMTYKF